MAGLGGASRTLLPQGGNHRTNVHNADLIAPSMRKYLEYRESAKEIPPECARFGGGNRCAVRDAAKSGKRAIEDDEDGFGDEPDWEDEATENWGSRRKDFARVILPSRDSDSDDSRGPGSADEAAEVGDILDGREAPLNA